jgi:protein XagA
MAIGIFPFSLGENAARLPSSVKWMKRLVVFVLLFCLVPPASACAWTRPAGEWQVISEFLYSRAFRLFGNDSASSIKASFVKLSTKRTAEAGLSDNVTLILVPEYAEVRAWTADQHYLASGFTLETGMRVRLFDDAGVLSVQGAYKTAGIFAMSAAAGGIASQQAEVRLLYGTSFQFWETDGFVDFETSWRWVETPRPNEAVVDATAGVWLTSSNMVMLQNFNTVSVGPHRESYPEYRMHKLQASIVQQIDEDTSLQLGGFVTMAGRNAANERGVSLALWIRY